MSEPLLTIGVTTYNDERYVAECVDSALGQTHPSVEVIVVDDHSTDGTPGILERYGDRIRVVRHDANSGDPIRGRNEVLEAARGEFIHWLDADDILEPLFAEQVLGLFAYDPGFDWVAPDVISIDADGVEQDVWSYAAFPTTSMEGLRVAWAETTVPVPMKAVFRTTFLHDNALSWHRLPHTAHGEDAYTCVRFLERMPQIGLLPLPLIRYRLHSSQTSGSPEDRAWMTIDLKEYFISHFSEWVYLPHPHLLRLELGSGEYEAFKQFLIAQEFADARDRFTVPDVYGTPDPDAMKRARRLFEEPIRRHADLSLAASETYLAGINELLGQGTV